MARDNKQYKQKIDTLLEDDSILSWPNLLENSPKIGQLYKIYFQWASPSIKQLISYWNWRLFSIFFSTIFNKSV